MCKLVNLHFRFFTFETAIHGLVLTFPIAIFLLKLKFKNEDGSGRGNYFLKPSTAVFLTKGEWWKLKSESRSHKCLPKLLASAWCPLLFPKSSITSLYFTHATAIENKSFVNLLDKLRLQRCSHPLRWKKVPDKDVSSTGENFPWEESSNLGKSESREWVPHCRGMLSSALKIHGLQIPYSGSHAGIALLPSLIPCQWERW